MMRSCALIVCTLALLCGVLRSTGGADGPAPAPLRTWTDNTGKYQVQAGLVEQQGDNLVLQLADGSTITVPRAKLSPADLAYAKQAASSQGSVDAPVEDDGKQKTITDSIGMKLTLVPAGEFMMGSGEPLEEIQKLCPDSPPTMFENEFPQHRVRITKPFYMGTCEVTVGQFGQFVKKAGYKTDAETKGAGGNSCVNGILINTPNPQFNWKNCGFPQQDTHPVANVSRNDAQAFCKWLSETEQETYRLPTEAEWEYACRAGTKTRYQCGDDPEGLFRLANIADRTVRQFTPGAHAIQGNDNFGATAPVGRFKPNAFGLYDMHGNVMEWTSEYGFVGDYARSPVDDPKGPEVPPEEADSLPFHMRGGCYLSCPVAVRSSHRNVAMGAESQCTLGFRVVRE